MLQTVAHANLMQCVDGQGDDARQARRALGRSGDDHEELRIVDDGAPMMAL